MSDKYIWLLNPITGMERLDKAVKDRIVEEVELRSGEGLEIVACPMDYNFWLWKRK